LLSLFIHINDLFNMCDNIYVRDIRIIKRKQINITINNLKRAHLGRGMCLMIISKLNMRQAILPTFQVFI
jgi:hypothetical protein